MICNPHLLCAQLRCVTRYLRGRGWVLSVRALPTVDCNLLTEVWHDEGADALSGEAAWSYVSRMWCLWLLCCVSLNCAFWLCCVMFVNYGCDYFDFDIYNVISSLPYEILGCWVLRKGYLMRFWGNLLVLELRSRVLDLESMKWDFEEMFWYSIWGVVSIDWRTMGLRK